VLYHDHAIRLHDRVVGKMKTSLWICRTDVKTESQTPIEKLINLLV
jgi:hypothetical protein